MCVFFIQMNKSSGHKCCLVLHADPAPIERAKRRYYQELGVDVLRVANKKLRALFGEEPLHECVVERGRRQTERRLQMEQSPY